MSPAFIIYPLFLVFFGFILYSIFTKRGRNAFLRLAGYTVIQDYGQFSETVINGASQKLSLLLCEKKGARYVCVLARVLASSQFFIVPVTDLPKFLSDLEKVQSGQP